MKRRLSFVLAAGLAVLGIVVVTSGVALAAEKARVGTALKGVVWMELPMMAAEERGFWKEQNLEVEWTPFVGGGAMYRAMAGGHLQVGLSKIHSFTEAATGGVPGVIVADTGNEEFFEIWVRADSRIKKSEDLKGAKIGMARGAAHISGIVIARGLGLEKDVKFVAVGGTPERVAAVKAGAIDAFVQTFTPVVELMLKGELRSVASEKPFLPKDRASDVVTAHKDFVRKNPETVRRLIKAILSSLAFIQENRAWAIEKLRTNWRFSPEGAKLVYENLSFGKDGKINPKGVENARSYLVEFGGVSKEKVPPLEQLYTVEFTG